MTAMEQAINALRAATPFADYLAESSGDEDVIPLHCQCMKAIHAFQEESEREANYEQQRELAAA